MKRDKHFKFLLIGAIVFFSLAMIVNMGNIALNQTESTLVLNREQLASAQQKNNEYLCELQNSDMKCRSKCTTDYYDPSKRNFANCNLDGQDGPIKSALEKADEACGSNIKSSLETYACYSTKKLKIFSSSNRGSQGAQAQGNQATSTGVKIRSNAGGAGRAGAIYRGRDISEAVNAIRQAYNNLAWDAKKKACKKAIKKLINTINDEFNSASKTSASADDKSKCTYKKPVLCIKESGKDKYKCWPKKDGGKPRKGNGGKKGPDKGPATPPPGPGNNPNGPGNPPPGAGTGSGSGSMMNPFMQGMGQGMGQALGNAMMGNNNCIPYNPFMMNMMTQPQAQNGFWSGMGQSFGYLFGGLMTGRKPPSQQYCNQQQLQNNCANQSYAARYPQACKRVQPTTCVLVANKTHIKSGEAVRLKWQTQYARSIKFDTDTGVNITNNSASGEITVYPKRSGNITLKAGGDVNPYMSMPTNSCSRSVGIVVDGKTTPDEGEFPPELTCVPASIKQGESTRVKIDWSCSNGNPTTSAGSGIDTAGEISGSRDVYPAATTQYSVSCISNGQVIGKSYCTVLAESPMFKIIAWPKSAKTDERARISWGSIGMSTCRVTGPDNFAYEQRTGVVITTPFPQNSSRTEAIYTIECKDKFGQGYTKDISISKEQ